MLKSYKLKCDCAVNGRQALDKILREKDCDCQYSLILLDCNMPVMNGYDTCVEIRQLIKEKVVPAINILAVTADATKMNQERCLNCGFDNVVEKPIYKKTLEKLLLRHLLPDLYQNMITPKKERKPSMRKLAPYYITLGGGTPLQGNDGVIKD